MIIILFVIVVNSQVFRLVVIKKDEDICTAAAEYIHIYVPMHIYMYQLVLQFMLPACIILGCNIAILYKIRGMRRQLSQSGTVHVNEHYRKQHRTTCMLLTVSFTFILMLFPLVFLSMLMHVSVRMNPNMARFLMYHLNDARYVLELLSELNYGVNFYIYVLRGAQFRCQLRHMCSSSERYNTMSTRHTSLRTVHFRRMNNF